MSCCKSYKIALVGGDERQYYMAKEFISRGYASGIWRCRSQCDESICAPTLDNLTRGADAVVLPLPLSRDKEHLNCVGDKVRLSDVFSTVPSGVPALCGGADQFYRALAKEHGVTLYDYFDDEGVMIKNAWLTAEGAIEILIRELPVSIRGSRFSVFGFGRVGAATASAISSLGGEVYVFARSSRDLAAAAVAGCKPVPIKKAHCNELSFSAVINTVPFGLFDRQLLSVMKPDGIFLDLAGGETYDKETADMLGIRAIQALSVPGRFSPLSAAQILCESVLDILHREGYLI
jgi:dipicolinate synthase subunit A